MNPPPLKIGLVGLGRMGSYHLEKLMEHSQVELCGVLDKEHERAQSVAAGKGVKVFSSEEELFFESDAIIVASPTPTHFEIAKKALDNNLHVFVEKPICDHLESAAQLVRLAEQKNRVLQTGFVERYRWRSLMGELPQWFNKKPVLITTERNAIAPSREIGMDVVTDIMIHDVDFVLWLLGEPPVSIQASGVSVKNSVIDIAHARLEFSSGVTAHLQVNWLSPQRRRETQLVWEQGSLLHDQITGRAQISPTNVSLESKVTDPLQMQLDTFIEAVNGQAPVFSSGLEGLRTLEVVEAIKNKIWQQEFEKTRSSPKEKKFLSRFWSHYAN